MIKIKKYNPRKITTIKRAKYQQDTGNCRLYSVPNNLYLNCKITTDIEDFKIYLKSFRISTQWANTDYASGTMIVRYFKEKNIEFYELDVLDDTALFGKMLMSWYIFLYSRYSNQELLWDIYRDDEVDQEIKRKWGHHSTNICFKWGKLTEIWSRWDSNIYTEFTYDNIDLFIKCVKNWSIKRKVRFLDFKQ